MSENSKPDVETEYFFGELKKIELTEDDTAGVFSFIALPSPSPGFPVMPVMVAPAPSPGFAPGPFRPAPIY